MQNPINIPFYGIPRFYEQNAEDIVAAINAVHSKGNLLMGSEIDEFEKKISARCKRTFGVAVGSCTDALYFALLGAGVEKGDEVLITSLSYIASVSPILRAGAIPVFTDIDQKSFMMDLEDFKSKITPKTKAAVCVHLFGQMLPMRELNEIADAHDIVLIEDAAQALGSEQNGAPAGSMGLASCISFDPTKVIGAFGNGGVLLTDSEAIYKNTKKLRYHGKNEDTGKFESLGYNSRMATSQAALLILQMDKLEGNLERRREVAAIYNSELNAIKEISLPEISSGNVPAFHKYVIQAGKRIELRQHLSTHGIQTMVHYDTALFEHPLFDHFEYRAENISIAHQIKNKVLSLPIYPELEEEEVRYICSVIKSFYV